MSNFNNSIQDTADRMQRLSHDRTMENLKRQETNSTMNVSLATQQLAQEQHKANEIQLETIKILQEQQQELKRRNEILESDIKSTNKYNKLMLCLTIISTLIALGAMIAAFMK